MTPRLIMERTDDYEALVKLFSENGMEYDGDEPVPTDLVQCFKITHGGDLVAGIVLAKREGEYIVDGIAVDRIYRKLGIGKVLMNKALEEVEKLGGSRLFVNARVPDFYQAIGFHEVSKEEAPVFYECASCDQYNDTCHPKVMVKEV